MMFTETAIPGAYLIEPEADHDERGWFARTFDAEEHRRRGLEWEIVQASVSMNRRAGTLRGMHYQVAPHEECKLVTCTRGAAYDVIIDLRPDSPAFCDWLAFDLTPKNGRRVYVPRGVAHGFQTLEDATEMHYLMTHIHSPEHARGVRWSDPAFGIEWPQAEGRIISSRDRSYPDLDVSSLTATTNRAARG